MIYAEYIRGSLQISNKQWRYKFARVSICVYGRCLHLAANIYKNVKLQVRKDRILCGCAGGNCTFAPCCH